ncbi:Endonuclease/Exonuclease/phosphatase family protein [Amycolatopsis marina]|uniref:Endonuclease/Exonuclease/phosphatase family protein n=1 Tax=Amycolatopsis marina TaxID=490629 RepID=A0A1I0WMY2_9PSEU|nr:discoidin domain-containing protein [Amycolatopsis marina]SFA89568.1 Endonuclease/Exonuclease/phosphatase family protein [Amycolatopsis marina]
MRPLVRTTLAVGGALVLTALGAIPGETTGRHPGTDEVTFTLSAPPDLAVKHGRVGVKLVCGDRVAARAVFRAPHVAARTVPRRVLEAPCVVEVESAARSGRTDEGIVTVSASDGVVERHTAYTESGRLETRAFPVRPGALTVDVAIGSMPADEVGTALKVMAFNIWQGGRLEGRHEHGFEDENIAELLEFVRAEDPDVLFAVETYGTGKQIERALNRQQPADREFTGVQITREPGQEPDRDNLWLFTRLPVEEIYPVVEDDVLTSFNFGGARLGLPGGGHMHAFTTWLYHVGNTWSPTNRSAMEVALGLDRTSTNEELAATDHVRRTEMARTLLHERLEHYVGDDTAPVILGGDFNTQSHVDWSGRFADAAGHEGMVIDWPVLRAFDLAGFTDTYRYANPDAARYPGRTWSAANAFMYAPARIDYVMTRGERVRVLGSSTRSVRLPEQRGDALDDLYPFYSDHSAVVTELLIRGPGTGPEGPPTSDKPESGEPITWPQPPPGEPIPAAELTATASTETPGSTGRAVDGDPRTHWHSRTIPDPPEPHPHVLTVDLGRDRVLTGLRYQPRIDGYNGIITRFVVQVSADGENFQDVTSGEWARDSLPKDLTFADTDARYLRLVSVAGVGGYTTVAELTPYE